MRLTEVLPLPVAEIDLARRLVWANGAYRAWFGHDDAALAGRPVQEVLGAPAYGQISGHLDVALRGQAVATDQVLQVEDRPARHVRVHCLPKIGDDGAVAGAVLLAEDLGEQRRLADALRASEERLRSVIEAAPDAIITIDDQGTLSSFSRHAEKLFGYRGEEVIGRNVKMLMPSPYQDEHDAYIARYRATGEKKIIGIGRQVMARRKDGSVFPIHLAVNEMIIDGRQMFTGVVRDITEDQARREALRQAQKMEAVGQLTGGIAHDFNNLLTVIMGNLEMLELRLENDAEATGLVQQAQEAAEAGAGLTSRLLAFARRQPLEPKTLDLNDLVVQMSDLLHRTLGATVQISTIQAPDLAPTLADPTQLQNALLNLALNARDAMPQGGRLVIETGQAELDEEYARAHGDVAPGRYVMLSVTDTGTGMPPEVRERVFEPFFTTKQGGAGSGLGLSMVYGFVKQSQGYVQVYSEPGHGTTVSLYLPRVNSPADLVVEPVRHSPAGRGEVVLVVEDDPRVRLVTVNRLRALGYKVLEADSGPAALAVLGSAAAIDLLFTDMVMPGGMTGRDLARETRKRHPAMKILFTSGYAEQASLLPSGHDDTRWLRKPYARADLAQKLREILDR